MGLEVIKEFNGEQLDFMKYVLEKQNEKAFQDALAKAKLEFKAIKRTQSVSYRTKAGQKSYKYADLKALHDAVDTPLAKYGLTVRTDTGKTENGKQWAVTVISGHGHTLRTSYQEGFVVNDIQQEGAQGTYIERYSLSKALGLSSDEDTDASQFSGENQRQNAEKPKTINQAQMNTISNKLNEIGANVGKKPAEVAKELESKLSCAIRQLPVTRFSEAMGILNNWE